MVLIDSLSLSFASSTLTYEIKSKRNSDGSLAKQTVKVNASFEFFFYSVR